MKKWIAKIYAFILSLLGKAKPEEVKREDGLFRYVHYSDFPDDLNSHIVYLQGQPDMEWLAGFLCPCGCGDLVELVLLKGEHPRWTLTKNYDKTVSFHPSVWRTAGCRSHFFVTNGMIRWC